MHAKSWQISLKRILWATFLMAVCSLVWSRANLRQVALPDIVLAAVLQVIIFVIAIRVPVLYSRTSAVLGMTTLLLFVLWGMLRVP